MGKNENYDKVMCDFLCEKYEDRYGKSSLNEIKNYHAMYGNPDDFYSSVLSQVSKGLDSHFYYVLSEGKNICYDGIQTDEAINHILSLKNELSLSIEKASNIDAGFNGIPIPYNKVVEKELQPRFFEIMNTLVDNLDGSYNDCINLISEISDNIVDYSQGADFGDSLSTFINNGCTFSTREDPIEKWEHDKNQKEELDPKDSEPKDTEPKDTEPKDTEPEEPEDIEPEDTEPEEPEDTEPEDTEPEDTEPKDPKPKNPKPKNPEPRDPEPKDPKPKDPEPKDPKPKDPKPKDPEPKDPEPEGPEPKEPDPKDPEPEGPEPKEPDPKDPEPDDSGGGFGNRSDSDSNDGFGKIYGSVNNSINGLTTSGINDIDANNVDDSKLSEAYDNSNNTNNKFIVPSLNNLNKPNENVKSAGSLLGAGAALTAASLALGVKAYHDKKIDDDSNNESIEEKLDEENLNEGNIGLKNIETGGNLDFNSKGVQFVKELLDEGEGDE